MLAQMRSLLVRVLVLVRVRMPVLVPALVPVHVRVLPLVRVLGVEHSTLV